VCQRPNRFWKPRHLQPCSPRTGSRSVPTGCQSYVSRCTGRASFDAGVLHFRNFHPITFTRFLF
jgi:hypothetical protein